MSTLTVSRLQQILKGNIQPSSSSFSSSSYENNDKDDEDVIVQQDVSSSSSSSLSDDDPLSPERETNLFIFKNKSVEDPKVEMTPYNDALWLSSMWPCQRPSSSSSSTLIDDEDQEKEKEEKEISSLTYHQCNHACNRGLLHDGKDWHAWNEIERRWLVANQMMHRLVAESCPQPHRKLKLICEANMICCLQGDTRDLSVHMMYKENLERSRAIQKHLERLHTLMYQKKVLTIAAKLFFSLPTLTDNPLSHWGPGFNVLPLSKEEEGDVLVFKEEEEEEERIIFKVEQRKAEPKDRLHQHTPLAPFRHDAPTQWMHAFRAKDLEILRQSLSRALLRPSTSSPFVTTLILWGIAPPVANEFVTFMKLTLGESYCCFLPCPPTQYARVVIEALTPRSEQKMFSPMFKQSLLHSLSPKPEVATLKIILVKSINQCICSIPPELDLLDHPLFFTMLGTQVIDPKTRFWGSPPSSSPALVKQVKAEESIVFETSTLKHPNQIIQWLFY